MASLLSFVRALGSKVGGCKRQCASLSFQLERFCLSLVTLARFESIDKTKFKMTLISELSAEHRAKRFAAVVLADNGRQPSTSLPLD